MTYEIAIARSSGLPLLVRAEPSFEGQIIIKKKKKRNEWNLKVKKAKKRLSNGHFHRLQSIERRCISSLHWVRIIQ